MDGLAMKRPYAESAPMKTVLFSRTRLMTGTLRGVHRAIRHMATLLCLAATAAAAYNVYGDNGEVEKAAKRTACGDTSADCRPETTRTDRSPFAQTFEFVISKRNLPITVRCTRSAILIGDYTCALHPSDR